MQKSTARTTLFSLLLLACMIVSASAHPGKTDSNGGHTDRSTGEYHYHHGYLAHKHTGGVCPYHFDDRTDHSSRGSSSSSDTNPYREKDSSRVREVYSFPASSKNKSEKGSPPAPQSESSFSWWPILGTVIAIPALISIYKLVRFLRERNIYKKKYAGFYARDLAHVPKEVYFDRKSLPHSLNTLYDPDTVDQFMVYYSPNGKVYHRKGCHVAATLETNLVELPPKLTPCARCNPPPRPEWYGKYIEILKIKRKYHI